MMVVVEVRPARRTAQRSRSVEPFSGAVQCAAGSSAQTLRAPADNLVPDREHGLMGQPAQKQFTRKWRPASPAKRDNPGKARHTWGAYTNNCSIMKPTRRPGRGISAHQGVEKVLEFGFRVVGESAVHGTGLDDRAPRGREPAKARPEWLRGPRHP